jgi:23S rRNA (pseudouridine1915-N3)-methyltransferase
MVINLIAVGKRMPGWIEQGYNEYAKRMPVDFKLHLIEIPTSKYAGKDVTRMIQQEGELMLAAIPKNNYLIALDVLGESWDTQQLAKNLQNWHDQSQDVSLLVGGADGLAQSCLTKAQRKWSLSSLTFPHPLVRVILAEQIYRAYSILTNHPYHRN